jgi:hypothetical protein
LISVAIKKEDYDTINGLRITMIFLLFLIALKLAHSASVSIFDLDSTFRAEDFAGQLSKTEIYKHLSTRANVSFDINSIQSSFVVDRFALVNSKMTTLSDSRGFQEKPAQTKEDISIQRVNDQFTCAKFDEEYSPYFFCSGVVDYDFILFQNESLMDLNTKALSQAMYLNEFIDNKCLSDAKRLICSRVYQPCVTNGLIVSFDLILILDSFVM